VCAVLKKNIVLKLRLPKTTFFEFAMPLFYAAFLFFFTNFKQPTEAPAVNYFDPLSLTIPSCTSDSSRIFYAPDLQQHQNAMNGSMHLLGSKTDCLRGFSTFDAMRDEIFKVKTAKDIRRGKGVASAVFLDIDKESSDWSYTMMVELATLQGFTPTASSMASFSLDWATNNEGLPWARSGLLAMQWALDRRLALPMSAAA
jgi:hypothetical protein